MINFTKKYRICQGKKPSHADAGIAICIHLPYIEGSTLASDFPEISYVIRISMGLLESTIYIVMISVG